MARCDIDINQIESWDIIPPIPTVYDITVEDSHCYYLSTNSSPILVHNSGKTYNILIWFLVRLFNERDKVFTICRASLPSLKGSVLRDFVAILDSMNMYDESMHNKTENTYLYRGNLIEFISIDQPQKIRGRKRDYLFCNEANELPYDAWFQLLVRTSSAQKDGYVKAVMDFNPSFTSHWIDEKVINREDSDFYKTTYKDNPFLDNATIKEIEGLRDIDDNYWKVYGLGEKANIQNCIFTNWDIVDEMPPVDDYCYGVDFGFNNPSAVVKIGWKDDEIYVKELLYERRLTNSDLIGKFSNINISNSDEIYCDSAEPDRREEILRAGYNCLSANKAVKTGIGYLKSHKLHIVAGSDNLIKEMKFYRWKTMKDTEEPMDEPVKFLDHAVDAMRYGAYSRALQLDWDCIFF